MNELDVGQRQITSDLLSIFELLNLSYSLADCEIVAVKLSALVGQQPPWSAKYIYAVMKGYKSVPASLLLSKAIAAMGQLQDGSPNVLAGASFVKFIVQAGEFYPEGTVVPRGSKLLTCGRPGCGIKFIRTNYFQKYCGKTCRDLWNKQRRAHDPNI